VTLDRPSPAGACPALAGADRPAEGNLGAMDSSAWDERYRSDPNPWGLEPNRFVRLQCERLAVGQALDLACGEGRNALWLAQLGWRVTAVDFSAVAIGRAKERTARQFPSLGRRMVWRVEDVTRLQLKPGTIDLALASYVQLPPAERDAMLVAAAQALRPEGHLVVVAHDKRNLTEGVSGPQDVDLLYDPAQVRDLLSQTCGLTVEVARTMERPTPNGTALDTVVRARRPDVESTPSTAPGLRTDLPGAAAGGHR
jgi:SAM-dependent methyltransferase